MEGGSPKVGNGAGELQKRLQPLRAQVDAIDKELVELLARRLEIARQVGEAKGQHMGPGQPMAVLEREEEVLRRVAELAGERISPASVAAIFREIIAAMLSLEQAQEIACLGPAGTFSELAVRQRFGHSCKAQYCADTEEIFRVVANAEAHWGMVPLENSFTGPVRETFDCLREASEVSICSEFILPVRVCLLGKSGMESDLAAVRLVFGHAKALEQCHHWLRAHLPLAEVRPVSSNGEAARQAASSATPGLAVGPEHAAGAWGISVLRRGIEDKPGNHTRFAVIGRGACKPTGRDRTLAVFAVRHEPSALHQVLGCFAGHGVNLTMLHSHPSGESQFSYNFYMEAEGHADAEPLKSALADLEARVAWIRLLGSFPAASG